VETFQASLIELESARSPSLKEKQAGEVEEKSVEEKPAVEAEPDMKEKSADESVPKRRLPGHAGLRIGIEALGSPGGTDAMGAVNISLRWNFVPFLSVELDGIITLLSRSIKYGVGSASFDVAVVRGWVLWELLRRRTVKVCAGAGGGMLLAWSRGFVSGLYNTRTDVAYGGYAGGTVQVAFVLMKNLWLRLGLTTGVAIPRVRVVFLGVEVADFGLPLIEGFLNLELRVP